MAQVPQELIVEILLRLPVNSLLRFRCLSKPSCAVIDSPDFIKSHLCESSKNPNLHKLILSDQSGKNFHVCDVNLNVEEEILPDSSLVGAVSGNCNGLLLLYRSKIGFSVYNPSTRRRRDLPDCPFEDKLVSGLGYDESIDDYKAVVCVFDYKVFELQGWVCELKSNIWRRVDNFPASLPGFGPVGCFANGYLHWLCKPFTKENEFEFEVVAFDVSKEKFSLVPQPILFNSAPKLLVLEGRLCTSYLDWDCRMPIRADVYIMMAKDGVDTFTWMQLHSHEKPLKNVDASEHWKEGDKILLDLGFSRFCIVSYDLKKKSFKKVKMNKNPSWTAQILCLESLVPVGGEALTK